MQVSGIGIDSVQVDRLRRAIARWGREFLERLFTEEELRYCFTHADPLPSLAARFAAKEAMLKALHVRGGWKWREMEVERAESGKPSVALRGGAASFATTKGSSGFHISLTHDSDRAPAVVVAMEGK